MGSKVHDTLEEIIQGTKSESDLISALQAELAELDMLGIDFPKDRQGNDSIRNAWVLNMESFCNSFVKPKGEFETETLFILKLNEARAVIGYIDLIKHNKDGSVTILDWKTSSQFNKETLQEHGRQLVTYKMALEAQGLTVKEVAWIMLKYVEVRFMGKARSNSKSESEITKVVDRWKLVKELKPYLEKDLEALGYDEADIEVALVLADRNMSLDSLPTEVQQKYTIKPYVRKYEVTDEIQQETLKYLNKMACLFESKDEGKEEDWIPVQITNQNSFFCTNLCNHRKNCHYLKKFYTELELKKMDDEELF
jgi:hypothetical protein